MSILIKNGTIVTATDQYVGDVLVEGEKITTIGSALSMPADRIIAAKGKYVLPGGIDRLTISNLRVGDATLDLRFERLADQVVATPRNKTGQVDIVSRR